jgi:hypothetical protein
MTAREGSRAENDQGRAARAAGPSVEWDGVTA